MENISFADFQKLDIRVGQIKSAEDVEGADKLYKVIVDIGGEEREMVAGIKPHYTKDELPGRKVLVLVNLEPKKIRGVVSQGMILCAHPADRSTIICTTVEKEVETGAKIS
ncbi:methionine--tRNA ligase subunit beta [Candidatus Margulisiibacteriota bacterium]